MSDQSPEQSQESLQASFETMLEESQTEAFNDFVMESYSREGVVDEADLYRTAKGKEFYVVSETRWIPVEEAERYPAILSNLITCVPILIQGESQAILMHTFVPDNVAYYIQEERGSGQELTIDSFFQSQRDKPAQEVQHVMAKEAAEMSSLGTAHEIPSFFSVILYKGIVHFFDLNDKETYTYRIPGYSASDQTSGPGKPA
jgi:hypothetical protein